MVPQNDSIIALSKQSPTVPIEPSDPASRRRLANVQDVNCAPWSECKIVELDDGLRRATDAAIASMTRVLVWRIS
ncbi:hypothetical protein, partial [Actinomadura rubrisoli]|uniref:hypothetical protein n=1 Tax=Actinomadura rubrisoli TaxID=2530368 RepID=UPI001FB65519